MIRSLAAGLAVAFAAWWVINDPVSAGHVVHHLGDLLNATATKLKTALSSV